VSSTDVDAAAIESFLAAERGVTVTGTEVLHDGLNLSVLVSTEVGGDAYVLRRPNKLRHTAAFNGVAEEYGVLQRLQGTAVPAPEPVVRCEDPSIVGDPFLVMTYLDGEAVPLGSDLPERFRNPAARDRVADLLIDALADLHSLPAEQFTDVCERRTPREQVEHDLDRLETATAVTGHEPPGIWAVGEWLRENAPADPETTPAHGDFRPGNVLFGAGGVPEITGVLDWETAFLGDPLTELGYLLLRWRDDGDPTPSLSAIQDRYSNDAAIEELRETNERGLAPFTNEPGSPTRRELVARYEDRTGRSFENGRFYRAFAAFTLATVWEDLSRYQIAAGEESNREPHIDYMAQIADSIVSGDLRL
jgi:aminoglycoside phosphotransferase (APT) family kinase protein